MASPILARPMSLAIRQLCRNRPVLLPRQLERCASTKHPKGFVPPTSEDLDELRERVQVFTSMNMFLLSVSRSI